MFTSLQKGRKLLIGRLVTHVFSKLLLVENSGEEEQIWG